MKIFEVWIMVAIGVVIFFFLIDLRRRQKKVTKRLDHIEWGIKEGDISKYIEFQD